MFSLFSVHFPLFQGPISKRQSCTWQQLCICLSPMKSGEHVPMYCIGVLISHSPWLFLFSHFLLFIIWKIFLRETLFLQWLELGWQIFTLLFCSVTVERKFKHEVVEAWVHPVSGWGTGFFVRSGRIWSQVKAICCALNETQTNSECPHKIHVSKLERHRIGDGQFGG